MRTGEHLPPPTLAERIETCRRHLHYSVQWKGSVLGILEMRRHYTNYFKGLPGIKPFRTQLVTLHSLEEIDAVLEEIAQTYAEFVFA